MRKHLEGSVDMHDKKLDASRFTPSDPGAQREHRRMLEFEVNNVHPVPVSLNLSGCSFSENVKVGEKSLADFMSGINLMLNKMHESQNEYMGRVVAVRDLRRPQSPSAVQQDVEFNES